MLTVLDHNLGDNKRVAQTDDSNPFNTSKGDKLDEKLDALRDCIASLSEHERHCVELRYTQNLMPVEMCDTLGIALEAVKTQLLRAKQRLVLCITSKIEVARTQ